MTEEEKTEPKDPITTKHSNNGWRSKPTKSRKDRRQNYLMRKAEKALRRKRRKKSKKNKPRLILVPLRKDVFLNIKAPENFSFIDNTEEVLAYFKVAGKALSERNQVQFDLKDITNLTPDAIALLIAKVKDKNFTRGINVGGENPEKKELKQIFHESGFLEHVNSSYKPPKNEKNLLMHQVTHKKVHPDIAKQVGVLSVGHTFKNTTKFQPIFKIMIECMANTDNHASLKTEGIYDWWLFTYCNPEKNITSFTFLDLGIGIFNSNPVSSYKEKLLTTLENISDLSLKDNVKLVPKLFSGEIYTSRTKDKKRGQGLPSIKECSENKHIKNFTIIANNVKISLPSLQTVKLENKFNGTFLYWELHP